MTVTYKTSRGARGVAGVLVDYKLVGWVSRGTDGWYAKLVGGEYTDVHYRTRREAAESLTSEKGVK